VTGSRGHRQRSLVHEVLLSCLHEQSRHGATASLARGIRDCAAVLVGVGAVYRLLIREPGGFAVAVPADLRT
jgi:hypothetical protein